MSYNTYTCKKCERTVIWICKDHDICALCHDDAEGSIEDLADRFLFSTVESKQKDFISEMHQLAKTSEDGKLIAEKALEMFMKAAQSFIDIGTDERITGVTQSRIDMAKRVFVDTTGNPPGVADMVELLAQELESEIAALIEGRGIEKGRPEA